MAWYLSDWGCLLSPSNVDKTYCNVSKATLEMTGPVSEPVGTRVTVTYICYMFVTSSFTQLNGCVSTVYQNVGKNNWTECANLPNNLGQLIQGAAISIKANHQNANYYNPHGNAATEFCQIKWPGCINKFEVYVFSIALRIERFHIFNLCFCHPATVQCISWPLLCQEGRAGPTIIILKRLSNGITQTIYPFIWSARRLYRGGRPLCPWFNGNVSW